MPKANAAAAPGPGYTDAPDTSGFASLDDAEEFLNVLYYGREGTGKTTHSLTMAQIPHPGNILVVNIEGGLKKTALQRRGIPTDRIKIWPQPGQRANFESLKNLHAQILGDLTDDPQSWQGVVFDSITEGAALLREDATADRYRRLDEQGRQFDPTFIDRGDYGVLADQMQRLLRRFRDLPCHFVMTALERFDEETGMYGPAVSPAMQNAVMGYADVALFTKASQASVENNDDLVAEFRAATRPSNTWRAKDRYDALPHVMADPTFARVSLYVSGDLVEADDLLQAEYVARQAERDRIAAEEKAAAEAAKAARKAAK